MANPLCKCYSVPVRVTAADLPEVDPDTFEEFDIYESCGLQVSTPKREFRPGHDAKLKSVLIRLNRENREFTYREGGVNISTPPMQVARERGWEHFMTPVKPKKVRKVKDADKPNEPVESTDPREVFSGDRGELDPETLEPTEEEPAGFYPVQVRVRGTWYDGSVVSRTNGKTHVAYEDRKGNPREVTVEEGGDRLRSA